MAVGREYARRKGLRFIDCGHELEARLGVKVATIFEIEGEAGFRRRESLLLDELTQGQGLVLATGGGVVLNPENRRLLASRGVDRAAALAALAPRTQGAIANAGARGLTDGLTGPIRRGDVGTVERHLAAVAHDPELAQLYRVLGRRTLGLARPGLSDAAAAALARLLA